MSENNLSDSIEVGYLCTDDLFCYEGYWYKVVLRNETSKTILAKKTESGQSYQFPYFQIVKLKKYAKDL